MKEESFEWACRIGSEMFEFAIWETSECVLCKSIGHNEATLEGRESGDCLCINCAENLCDVPKDVIAVMNRIAREERDARNEDVPQLIKGRVWDWGCYICMLGQDMVCRWEGKPFPAHLIAKGEMGLTGPYFSIMSWGIHGFK